MGRGRPLARIIGAAMLLASTRAEAITADPIAAGCFATRRGCHLQLDAFTLHIAPGQHLESLQVLLGRGTVYDFRPDQSNPPSLDYTPTMPRLGFAARCETSYVATVLAQDTGDASPVTLGQTTSFTCPKAVPEPGAGPLGAVAALALLARARARHHFG